MKPSEQPPHFTGNNVSQADERVPVTAARVFSNYVLVPAARHPDEAEAAARLHGAALLVFGDKSAEKVQLRTGYATHVAGNLASASSMAGAGSSALRPGKDAGDEIASRHSEIHKENEVEAMTNEQVLEGPRLSLWAVLLIAVATFFVFTYIYSGYQRNQAKATQEIFLADLHAGKLSTPEAFEARCSQPRWTTETKAGTELHYLNGNDYYVTFANGRPQLAIGHVEIVNGKPREWRSRPDDGFYLSALGCK
jgi:hypothetical protein